MQQFQRKWMFLLVLACCGCSHMVSCSNFMPEEPPLLPTLEEESELTGTAVPLENVPKWVQKAFREDFPNEEPISIEKFDNGNYRFKMQGDKVWNSHPPDWNIPDRNRGGVI